MICPFCGTKQAYDDEIELNPEHRAATTVFFIDCVTCSRDLMITVIGEKTHAIS